MLSHVTKRKGIILAGGSGTRLYPLTQVVSKQLMPVYDKPMIYYPLSTLMLAGIRDILIISTPHDMPRFQQLLGSGSHLGMNFQYITQIFPNGLAESLLLGEEFLDGSPSALILGDNIFHGHDLSTTLQCISSHYDNNTIFAYHVSNPSAYGVVEFNSDGQAINITEKPATPKSSYAIPGLYFYDSNASEYAKQIKPSPRGELEISDLNQLYLDNGKLFVHVLNRGTAWLDTGTHSDLLDAGQFIKTIEERQGLKIACIEEIAYKMGYIDNEDVRRLAVPLKKSGYGEYLIRVVDEGFFHAKA
jgi:glucose-1-phosphate thymidylyltransferase